MTKFQVVWACQNIFAELVSVVHTAIPSHPMKRWCLSKALWWLLAFIRILQPQLRSEGRSHLRTHGKALMMETMTSTLVMTPVAITEACWTEWWRRMSTILKMSHLDDG